MATSRSLIPPKVQVPIAIGLACVFVIVLVWRFYPRQSVEGIPASSEDAESPPVEISLGDLRRLVADLQPDDVAHVTAQPTLPQLVRNPFRWRVEDIPHRRKGGSAEPAEVPAEDNTLSELLQTVAREESLKSLSLLGTCIAGETGIALVNGRYVRPGDAIAGFTVREIREREIVVADELGSEVVVMPRPEWLGGQENDAEWGYEEEEEAPL